MTDRTRVADDRCPFPFLGAFLTAFALTVALPGLAAGQAAGRDAASVVSRAPAVQQETTPPIAGGRLSLEQAIAMAGERSEQVAVARAGVQRAEGEQVRARADLFPHLQGSASYDRTLASEFSGIFDGTGGSACDPFTLRPAAPLEDRVAEIERAIDCGAVGGSFFGGDGGEGGDGGDVQLPFGQKNIYRLDLSLSQSLYTGGRVPAQRALALAGRRLAQEGLASARAQVVLDVTQAYYDAALSEQLAAIAESGLRQATATLDQVELSFKAGRLPEFEVLRARVARDNQRPLVVRTQSQRTIAYLRLRQLLHVAADTPLAVEANLDDPELPPPAPFSAGLPPPGARARPSRRRPASP